MGGVVGVNSNITSSSLATCLPTEKPLMAFTGFPTVMVSQRLLVLYLRDKALVFEAHSYNVPGTNYPPCV